MLHGQLSTRPQPGPLRTFGAEDPPHLLHLVLVLRLPTALLYQGLAPVSLYIKHNTTLNYELTLCKRAMLPVREGPWGWRYLRAFPFHFRHHLSIWLVDNRANRPFAFNHMGFERRRIGV